MELHCNICYEDFDLTDRYPVVLPCGHTYVCITCTKSFSPKVCHVCREPLVFYPPKPQQPAATNHNRNITRSPAQARYSRYNNRYSPSSPVPNSTRPEKVEPIPLPLPKNLVLMEMIEAKQRQERLLEEQKAERLQKKRERLREKKLKAQQHRNEEDNFLRRRFSSDSQDVELDINGNDSLLDIAADDEYVEVDYDDELSTSSSTSLPLGDPELISGYAALSGACGTYAVRESEGLVVLPLDPNRKKYRVAKDHDDEKKDGSHHSSARFSAIFRNVDGDKNIDTEEDRKPSSRKEPFSIAEGQKVQVVGVMESNDHSVYQLARGAGYIVASGKQLVKVGGPMENSCKMEGMLKSILEKEQEMEKKLRKLRNLSEGLKNNIILEQEKPEEVPVISVPTQKKSDEADLSASSARDGNNAAAVSIHANLGTGPPPKTPTRPTSYLPRSPPGGSAGQDSVPSVNSTVVDVNLSPRTPAQRTPYMVDHQGDYVYSPAATCPLPSTNTTDIHPNLNQPFLDDDAPSSTGVLRYRVNSEDDTSGLGLAGFLGCGTSLFGGRIMDSSDSSARNNINRNSDIFRMSQNALMQQANAERRAAALAAVAAAGTSGYRGMGLLDERASGEYTNSPLRRGGSFDNGAGVNFRTGMSGHSGLARTHQNQEFGSQQPRRRMVMNMSQHRGAAQIRLGPRSTTTHQRRTSAPPDQLVGCQTIR